MHRITRNVIRPHYALITPDGHVGSSLPGWNAATINVLLSATLGAGLGHTFSEAAAGGVSDGSWSASQGIPTLDGLGPVGGHGPYQEAEGQHAAVGAGQLEVQRSRRQGPGS